MGNKLKKYNVKGENWEVEVTVNIEVFEGQEHMEAATRALELGLVDSLATSDDVIVKAAQEADVYRISADKKRSLFERITHATRAFVEQQNWI